MFYLAGISISFFLALILFSKARQQLADRILASWLVVVGIHLFLFYAGITELMYEVPWLLGLHLPFPLLHGPFLFLYASTQTGRLQKWNLKSGLHFTPVLASYIYLFPYFLLPEETKIWVYKNRGAGYETYMWINGMAILASGLAYITATTLLLMRYRKQILQEFSDTEKISLRWIQYLIYGISLIWLFVILENDNLVFGTAVCFVVFIGYFGIRQVGIFTLSPGYVPIKEQESDDSLPEVQILPEEENSTVTQAAVQRKKYEKSGLSDVMATQLHKELRYQMQTAKLYTQSELTLADLSKQLSMHPNHLSQVINEKEGLNFYDYINSLRVEEFKQRLLQPDHQKFTLLALAFECGFNSKSSFNKYFRKVTGLTPTAYLEQLVNQ